MTAPDEILTRLQLLRAGDAPTHGGRVLSYVYDSGRPELDELAERAAALSDGFLKTLSDNGMTVAEPGEQLSADLGKIGEQMTTEWLEATGEDGKAIIDAYRAE